MEDAAGSPSDDGHRKSSGKTFGGGVSKKRGAKKKALGQQIRSIERMLAKIGDKMAPAAKREKEEEVRSLKALQKDRKRRQTEMEMSEKYRMLKFFERQKVERKLKQIEGKTDAESAQKREQLAKDLRYITLYPKDCKYIALFPSEGHNEKSEKQVEQMRQRIDGKGAPGMDNPSVDIDARGKREGEDDKERDAIGNEPEDDFFLADD